MPDSILSTAERALILELQRRGLRFMIVGMSGALLQGARGATEDIDLWLENPSDPAQPCDSGAACSGPIATSSPDFVSYPM
jgi:hypothetical protein